MKMHFVVFILAMAFQLVTPAAAQPVFVSPPAGLRLELSETSVDFSQFALTTLHLRLVNGSAATVSVPNPGYGWLQGVSKADSSLSCHFRDGAFHGIPSAQPLVLAPGQTYAFTLPLSDFFCMGVNGATAVNAVLQVYIREGARQGDAQVGSAMLPVLGEVPAPLAIRFVLEEQQQWWNQSNIEDFARGYKDSPDILFVGSEIRRGYAQMLASYRKNYPTPVAMGHLSFTNLEVHPLDAHFATVLGNFHLERTAAGGGNADGFYSLVLEKTAAGWKIILDHTTSAAH